MNGAQYWKTEDADPRHVYHDVPPARGIGHEVNCRCKFSAILVRRRHIASRSRRDARAPSPMMQAWPDHLIGEGDLVKLRGGAHRDDRPATTERGNGEAIQSEAIV
jgi:hypothetical protein